MFFVVCLIVSIGSAAGLFFAGLQAWEAHRTARAGQNLKQRKTYYLFMAVLAAFSLTFGGVATFLAISSQSGSSLTSQTSNQKGTLTYLSQKIDHPMTCSGACSGGLWFHRADASAGANESFIYLGSKAGSFVVTQVTLSAQKRTIFQGVPEKVLLAPTKDGYILQFPPSLEDGLQYTIQVDVQLNGIANRFSLSFTYTPTLVHVTPNS